MKKLQNDEEYENYNFSFIIGLDNANSFEKWVNYDDLERLVRFVIVPRKGYDIVPNSWYFNNPHIFLTEETDSISLISSTEIRNNLKDYSENKSKDSIYFLEEYLNKDVLEYILEKNFYI
jgi:nicotinate-nucleotide adenylyltransferase